MKTEPQGRKARLITDMTRTTIARGNGDKPVGYSG
jgi:hypothetical protein